MPPGEHWASKGFLGEVQGGPEQAGGGGKPLGSGKRRSAKQGPMQSQAHLPIDRTESDRIAWAGVGALS